MKFKNKQDFLDTAELEYERFLKLLAAIPPAARTRGGVWGDGWTVKDMLAHIHEWHLMVLGWYRQGLKGAVEMPAPGYKWSETPRLNAEIYKRHKGIGLGDAEKKMKQTHARVMKLARSLSERQLLQKGQFDWCGKNAITTYLAGAIVSHYRWGQKKLKPLASAQAKGEK